MPVLTVANVTIQYPRMDTPAVSDASLTMDAGEFVSLLGPSGCGKTSLLRVIGGLLSPTSGAIELDGQLSMRPSPEKAFVFQHFSLFPWRTALENAAYILEIQKVHRGERLERALAALRLVGLEGFESHYPQELSGGMQQRVGVARALTTEPRLLLMDEPFGALDALTRERLQIELSKICTSQSLTTLFVTHSIDEAIVLSDRILVMASHPGRIVAEIPVVIGRPRTVEEVRISPTFAEIRARIWNLLKDQVATKKSTEDAPSVSTRGIRWKR